MGFNQEIKKARDKSIPIGLRYISLLHCISSFSWLTYCNFSDEIRHLQQICDLKQGRLNSSEVIELSINELLRQRKQFLTRLGKFTDNRKAEKKSGKRSPSKMDLDALYDLKEILKDKEPESSYPR